jgi:hypothetical protein
MLASALLMALSPKMFHTFVLNRISIVLIQIIILLHNSSGCVLDREVGKKSEIYLGKKILDSETITKNLKLL